MSPTLRNLVAISCILMAGSAAAEELDTRFYISPTVNYTVTDKDWGTDDGYGVGIGLGKPVSDSWNLELNATYATQGFKSANTRGRVQNTAVMADALYFFNRNPSFSPYAIMGAGDVQTRYTGVSENNLAANVGLGFMSWMNDIALRADVRYRYIDGIAGGANNFSPKDWIASVGLVIPLGAKPVAPAPEPAPAPYVAPAPAPVAAPEPAPAPVAQPEIARPVAHTKVIFDGTNFDFDKATLRPTGKAKLDDNVRSLTQYPDIDVEITGHTDSVGSDKYNQKLSEERAMTVKRYMESKGIAASRMTTKGYGETKPIASNKTKAGRAENRRVEIEIMN